MIIDIFKYINFYILIYKLITIMFKIITTNPLKTINVIKRVNNSIYICFYILNFKYAINIYFMDSILTKSSQFTL